MRRRSRHAPISGAVRRRAFRGERRRWLGRAWLGGVAGLAVALGSGAAWAQQCNALHQVEITFRGARGFKPRELSIRAGDCVRWTNMTGIEHSAVAVDRSFHTGQLMPGSANTIRFDRPGEVPYTCGPHPPMVGKIIVEP